MEKVIEYEDFIVFSYRYAWDLMQKHAPEQWKGIARILDTIKLSQSEVEIYKEKVLSESLHRAFFKKGFRPACLKVKAEWIETKSDLDTERDLTVFETGSQILCNNCSKDNLALIILDSREKESFDTAREEIALLYTLGQIEFGLIVLPSRKLNQALRELYQKYGFPIEDEELDMATEQDFFHRKNPRLLTLELKEDCLEKGSCTVMG